VWADGPGGEMSRGRNVHGTNWQHGEKSRYLAYTIISQNIALNNQGWRNFRHQTAEIYYRATENPYLLIGRLD